MTIVPHRSIASRRGICGVAILLAALSSVVLTSAATVPDHLGHGPQKVFLVLGDSLDSGYQPGGIAGDPTCSQPAIDASGQGGWACVFLADLRAIDPRTQIRNLAVPGEDTCSFLSPPSCLNRRRGLTMTSIRVQSYDRKPGTASQAWLAWQVLKRHPGNVGPIALEIGLNDLEELPPPPATRYLAALRGRYDQILKGLTDRAPHADIILFDAYDVPEAQPVYLTFFQHLVHAEAKKYHALFVDLRGPFRGKTSTLLHPDNDHPTDAGQQYMAQILWQAYHHSLPQTPERY